MANLYDLKRFDLNLLVIFECIYQHLSISKAAETLFITPSAVSQSLQRLRIQLNDPLFVRSGKGITPTTVGVNLHHHLADNLNQLEKTINIMSNSELTKRFVIYGPQIFISGPVINIVTRLLDDPSIEIAHYDYVATSDNIEDLMSYRKADLVLSTSPIINRSVVCEPFKEVSTVLVCRKDHPRLEGRATREEILQERFATYTTEEPGIKGYQTEVDEQYLGRRTGLRTNSLIGMVNIIQKTDLIGIIPREFFDYLGGNGQLKAIITPEPLPSIMIYIIYNRSSMNTPSFAKVIERISAHDKFIE
ncbi:DNA-binding transcriptional repressor CitR [Pseudocitrobacter faecalis]|uniref:DNA-binding transcriptional repressor CitR n=1 Tax=Pseudocitrobacter faecalis TaxID=1398493 RepID=UPI003899DED9